MQLAMISTMDLPAYSNFTSTPGGTAAALVPTVVPSPVPSKITPQYDSTRISLPFRCQTRFRHPFSQGLANPPSGPIRISPSLLSRSQYLHCSPSGARPGRPLYVRLARRKELRSHCLFFSYPPRRRRCHSSAASTLLPSCSHPEQYALVCLPFTRRVLLPSEPCSTDHALLYYLTSHSSLKSIKLIAHLNPHRPSSQSAPCLRQSNST